MMLGSTVLEIGIGLVFAFLCVSLICTAVNELIASLFRSRARDLERGIGNLLDGSSQFPLRWWQVVWFRARRKPLPAPDAEGWAEKFFSHQLINGISKDDAPPSYVPAQTFVTVLMDLVAQTAAKGGTKTAPTINGLSTFDELRDSIMTIGNLKVRQALLPLLEEARSDLTRDISAVRKFNTQVEWWFDHGMDRVSGWYKRRTQGVLLVIAIITALLLNIDAVQICRTLSTDSVMRASLVSAADQFAKHAASQTTAQAANDTQDFPAAIQSLQKSVGNFGQLGIPVGWAGWCSPKEPVEPGKEYVVETLSDHPLLKLFGLLATAIAASLGAPFWFDVLNLFMSVRSSGKAPEERPKDPKVVPQPQSP